MARLAGSPARLSAIAWARVCDIRNKLDGLVTEDFSLKDYLTPQERRRLWRARRHIDQARNEIMRIQSSASKRVKAAGLEGPDYMTARRIER